METFISAQKELVQQIIRSNSNFKKTPGDRLSVPYVQTKLNLLDQTWNSIQEHHLKLLRSFDRKALDKTDYFSEDVYGQAENEYTWTKVTMLEKLELLTPKSSHKTTMEGETSRQSETKPVEVKIPVIKIPIFDGSYTEWFSFRDQFVSLIHENKSLSNVQKLHYLKSNVSGDARNLIKNISTTENNYKYAWEKLSKRFSNNRVIVKAYLNRLMSIRQIYNESAVAIKNLLDTTTDCLSALNSAGVKTKEWDAIVIYITVTKLDTSSVRLWEELINKDNDDKLPTWIMMTNFLESRFRSLEGVQPSRTNTVRTAQKCITPFVEKKVYHTNTENKKQMCVYCNGEHYIQKCDQFIALNYEKKKEFIEKNNLCFNCLIPNHPVKYCKQRKRCDTCGKKHSSLIHPPENGDEIRVAHLRKETSNTEDQIQSTDSENEEIATHLSTRTKMNVLLATALGKVRAESGKELQLRALIDQESEGSFITESTTQALGLRRRTINGSVSGIGETAILKTKHIVRFKVHSNTHTEFELDVNAYVLKSLTRLLPTRQVLVSSPQLVDLPLADPTYGTPGKIDLLLGAAVYSRIIQNGVITGPPGTPLAQNTSLGWILSGEVHTSITEKQNKILSMHIIATEDENLLLRKFWEIESDEMSKKKLMTEEEIACEKHYESTYSRDKSGRYIVHIPIKDKYYDYGNTRDFAKKRLEWLEKRLRKDKELEKEYTKVLMEYVELEHMEEIDKNDKKINNKKVFYLPHHAVVKKDRLTSKVRVVFDASFHVPNHKSLNENMMIGPTVQRDLRHIVMTWRVHEIAIIADCVKIYRQIKVTDTNADLQRILWRVNGELKEYRITRVTFGTASAPYLATKTIQQLSNDEKERFPIASKIAKRDIYMDDLLTEADNLEEIKEIYNQISGLLNSGRFNMQKWTSNNQDFVNYVKLEDLNTSSMYAVQNDNIVKTLGITWDRNTDRFHYTINLNQITDETATKRTMLGTIARLFDPIGWLAPVVVTAKIIIQKLWLAGVDWDQEVPEHLKNEWNQYKKELSKVKDITLDRWLRTNKDDLGQELHGYADASTMAYAAVVYLRVIKRDGTIHTKLLTARSKVAPTRTISVPRLELCAAVLLANLLIDVAEQFEIPLINIKAYTDSTVVLAWLQSHPSRWKTFIANRTSEILNLLPSQHWNHVCSRPTLMLSHLRNRFWVPHAKRLLKTVLHKCVICTRYAASTSTQMMGSLPRVRVTPARPFLNSGVDLAGPIDLRLFKGRGCKTQKGYIVIFICMVTRAIHIEIVTGLTAQEFIAAFKRFVSRRGRCNDMYSDNATNLKAGNKELMSAFERTFDSVRKEIEDLLANDGTNWHHIPASAAHFGGLWEAGVKSIKYHFKRVEPSY